MGKPPIPDAQLLDEFDVDPVGMGYKTAPVEADGYKTTRELLQLLGGRRLVANPDAAAKVPAPMDIGNLFNALTDAELAAISVDALSLVRDRIEADDRTGVKRLIKVALKKSWINQAKHDAIVAAVDATVDDPAYHPQVYDPQTPRLTARWNEGGITSEQVDRVIGRI